MNDHMHLQLEVDRQLFRSTQHNFITYSLYSHRSLNLAKHNGNKYTALMSNCLFTSLARVLL